MIPSGAEPSRSALQAAVQVLAAAAADDALLRGALAADGAAGWRDLVRDLRQEAAGGNQPRHLALRRLLPALDAVSAVVEVRRHSLRALPRQQQGV